MSKFRPVKLGKERLDVILFSSCADSSSKVAAYLEVLFRLLTPNTHSVVYRHLKRKLENCNRRYQKDSIRRITLRARCSTRKSVFDCANHYMVNSSRA